MPTLKPISAFRVHNEGCSMLFFYPDGNTLASVTCEWDGEEEDMTGVLKVWAPGSGVVAAHRDLDYDNDIALSPDGKLLAWSGPEGQFRLFDGPTGRELETIRLVQTQDDVKHVLFTPTGRLLLVAAGHGLADLEGGDVYLWDVATKQVLAALPTGRVMSLALAPDGRTLAVGLVEGGVQLWDLATRQRLMEFPGHHAQVKSLAFNGSGTLLASAGLSEALKLWDLSGPQPTNRTLLPKGSGRAVNVVAFIPGSDALVTGDEAGDTMVWDVASGHVVTRYNTNETFGEFELVEEPEQITIQSRKAPEVTAIAFSQDGQKIATGNLRGGVQIWAVETGP